ncbi:MAG: hypothetical protein Q8P22_12030 [Chloroflexota bacterium]|nr:hypothetical protein [Chloroflexota bacterium]
MTAFDAGIALHPTYVRQRALAAGFTYPSRAEQEPLAGWSDFPVWPSLWRYVYDCLQGSGFPPLDELVGYLMAMTRSPLDDAGIRARAQKLVMDFTRDIHAYALLIHSGRFGAVSYERILDLGYNVDFRVRMQTELTAVGIQTAMRASWGNEPWTAIKEERRRRRGDKEWTGEIVWMTNRRIPAEHLPNKLWLFTMGHVDEVVAAINEGLASQSTLPF